MKDSAQQPGPRPDWFWLGCAAIALNFAARGPHAEARDPLLLVLGLLLLWVTLPLSWALADHGLRLAQRTAEQARLAGRYGADAHRVALWSDLAGPLHLALLTTVGTDALSVAWPLWAVGVVLGARVIAELLFERRDLEPSPRPLQAAARLWGPLLHQLVRIAPSGLRGQPLDAGPDHALAEAIEVGEQEGELTLAETNLLRREIDFGRRTVIDVMVPWARVETLRYGAPFEEILRAIRASNHSRHPACDAAGRVVGVLHAKQVLPLLDGAAPSTLPYRQVVRLAPDTPLDTALQALRASHTSLAVVENAGRPVGLVAVEDLIEELVGDIVDEADVGVVRESLQVDGRRTLDELAASGIDLPGEDREQTLAAFLAAQLDGPPAVGLQWRRGPLLLTIHDLDADGAIDEVHVTWLLSRRVGRS